MRIIIICIHFAPYEVTLILQLSLLILFGGMIMIFWPFQRNINTFCWILHIFILIFNVCFRDLFKKWLWYSVSLRVCCWFWWICFCNSLVWILHLLGHKTIHISRLLLLLLQNYQTKQSTQWYWLNTSFKIRSSNCWSYW